VLPAFSFVPHSTRGVRGVLLPFNRAQQLEKIATDRAREAIYL